MTMSILPTSFFAPITTTQASTNQSTPSTQQTGQSSSFGAAFMLDLSPAAMSAINGSTSGNSSGALSNPTSTVYSNMALTYSSGNTGALNTNNGFFDQALTNPSSTNPVANAEEGETETSNPLNLAPNNNASTASNTTSDATQGNNNTNAAQEHHGHHHHHGGGGSELSSNSSSSSSNNQDPLAQLLAAMDTSSGNGSSSTNSILPPTA